MEPYQFKLRSPERGKAWETTSSHLNATSHPKFRVTPRSVRDRYNLLTKKFQVRLNREERASGISDDNSELDNLLEEILEKEKEAKEKLDNDDEDKKKSLANEKAAAEDMRKRALERVGQTSKRKGQEEGPEAEKSKSRKSRKSTGEAVEYLKERASKEIQLREQELEMRKKEQAPVVQKVDSAIQRINHYPVDSTIGFPNTYPLDSDLSSGQSYPAFEQPGPGQYITKGERKE